MNTLKTIVLIIMVAAIACGATYYAIKPAPEPNSDTCDVHIVRQTSADLLYQFSSCNTKKAQDKEAASTRHLLVTDIYVKAWSYAFLNKLFFAASIFFAFFVLLWPLVTIFVKYIEKQKSKEYLTTQSITIIQTTITGVAALMFAFYSQYKDKQTYSENLMRSVIHAKVVDEDLITKVTTELQKIDRGFSFSEVIGQKSKDKSDG